MKKERVKKLIKEIAENHNNIIMKRFETISLKYKRDLLLLEAKNI